MGGAVEKRVFCFGRGGGCSGSEECEREGVGRGDPERGGGGDLERARGLRLESGRFMT